MALTRSRIPCDPRLTKAMVTVPPPGEGIAAIATAQYRPSASPNPDGPWFVCGTVASRSVLVPSA